MNIYLEIFGYIGSALVILSMMMKSMVKLRIFNISGAVISAIYSSIYAAWPVVVLNVVLVGVNSYHLIREFASKKERPSKVSAKKRSVAALHTENEGTEAIEKE